MRHIHAGRNPLKLAFKLVLLASFTALIGASNAGPADTLGKRIDGVYELMEWHAADGQVFRPPAVEGRFTVLDGYVSTIFTDRTKPPTANSLVAFGRYTLDQHQFAYAYDSISSITESPSGTMISHEPFWDGMRVFAVSLEGDGVHFRTQGGKQQFAFTAGGMTYSEEGVTRVWRRIAH